MPKLPGISHQQAVRALERAGFGVVRQGKVADVHGYEPIVVRDLA